MSKELQNQVITTILETFPELKEKYFSVFGPSSMMPTSSFKPCFDDKVIGVSMTCSITGASKIITVETDNDKINNIFKPLFDLEA